MPLIQITNTYRGAVLDLVQSCVPEGFQIRTLKENTIEALLDAVGDADYLLASGRIPIDRRVLAKAKRLKMVQRTGVGLDTLDLEALRQAGIPLYVNQGINAQSVAEHTLLLILACLRKLTVLDRNSKRGIWEKQAQGITTFELHGKSVGVVGMGSIGKKVVELLHAFGAQVFYYDAFRLSTEEEEARGVTYLPLPDLLAGMDVITLHCPLTEETRGLICQASLQRMKSGVILVNTARGQLICEPDLVQAIETGKVAFAGLDVHETEPYRLPDPLVQSERVIATPHVAGVSRDSFRGMMQGAMENIALFEAKRFSEIEKSRRV